MKTIVKKIGFVAVVLLATVVSTTSNAQSSGVYKNFADFQSGSLSYSINCATESHKIKLNDFLGKDFITVIHDGKSYNLNKVETWGYLLCDNKLVRFQGKEHYPVVEKDVIWIYVKESQKITGSPRNPKNETVKTYYFSKGGNSEIKELTLLNVKAAFPDNHMLHDALDGQFKSDDSLFEFDQFHKMYKINHFLQSQGVK